MRFTGAGIAHELICQTCDAADTEACDACADRAREGGWAGHVGAPGVVVAASTLRFELERGVDAGVPELLAVAPLAGADRARWLGAAVDGIYAWDLDAGTARRICPLPASVDADQRISLCASRDHRLAAIANTRGVPATIVDLDTGAVVRELVRDGYHSEHCDQSLAFLAHGGRTLLVHAPDWNRLDIIDPRTGEVLTARGPTSYTRGEERPAHYLDYFHARIAVSPGERAIADAGWVWHPIDCRWLDGNVWESEDGPSRRALDVLRLSPERADVLARRRSPRGGRGEDDFLARPGRARVRRRHRPRAARTSRPRGELAFDGRVLVSLGDDTDGAAVGCRGGQWRVRSRSRR